MKLFIFLLFISLSLKANYCVQIATSNKSERNYILNEASNHVYNQFNDLRVEPRDGYYVFRIGDYKHYSDAQYDFSKLKHLDKDAYIRKCDFLKEQSIFIKNESGSRKLQKNNSQSKYNDKAAKDTRKYYRDVSKDREANTRDDSPYENNADANSLWNDCKKCFVPLYEDEAIGNNREVERKERVEPRKRVKTTQRVEQRKSVNTSENMDEETFWRDEIGVDAYTTSDTQQKRENKFNVNEENLY